MKFCCQNIGDIEMILEVKPLCTAIGIQLIGLDPRKTLSELDSSYLYDTYLEHGLLLIRGFDLNPEQLISLSRHFGELAIHPIEAIRLERFPEIIKLGSVANEAGDDSDPVIVGAIDWHSDLTYTSTPSRAALLHAIEVPPEGGETGFIDTAAVYDELDPALKREIDGLLVAHSFGEDVGRQLGEVLPSELRHTSPVEFSVVVHPLVLHHPENGRKALNISPMFAKRIFAVEGGELDGGLLEELKAFATQKKFVYIHKWEKGDTLVWDNWRTMHSAPGYDRRFSRMMYRTTISCAPQCM